MTSIKLNSHVGPDGVLKLELPLSLRNAEVEIVVVVQAINPVAAAHAPEELGWPPGFFELTAGSIPHFPEIEYEGNFETRDELA